MSQQINLVNPALRPQKVLLSADQMAWVAACSVLLLFAYAGLLVRQNSVLGTERAALAAQMQAEQESLARAVQQYPTRVSSKVLQDEVAATQDKVSQREKVFAVLNSGVVGVNGGFSGLMQAFARQGVNGLWLTGFSANGAGDQMRISGRAVSPDLIPEYIGKLSTEQILRGRNFTGLQVSQPAPAPAVAAGQPKAAVAQLPAFVEFALSAEKAADKTAEKVVGITSAGTKS
jgi:hypothetical protein